MPFKSRKQQKFLWKNKPRLARRWTKKYGPYKKSKKRKTRRKKGRKRR